MGVVAWASWSTRAGDHLHLVDEQTREGDAARAGRAEVWKAKIVVGGSAKVGERGRIFHEIEYKDK